MANVSEQPVRPLLPNDVSWDELWWLYHNHPMLRQFIDRMVAEAMTAYKNHQDWERKL